MSAGRVLVLGDVMRDVVVHLHGPIRPGTDQRAAITTMAGGSAANLAAWLAHCGVPVRLLACVGAADLAAERERLTRLGVEPALVGHPSLPTGALIALVDTEGERTFLTDRGANDSLAEDAVTPSLLDGIVHLHVSGYAFVGAATRRAAGRLLALARDRTIPVSLDPGSAGFIADLGAEAMLEASAGANLCVANSAEAAALVGSDDAATQLRRLLQHVDLAVVKRGRHGAIAADRHGGAWEIAAPSIAVRDTIGAGDAFLAGFLAERLAGAPVETCLTRAVALGSRAVSRAGGLPPP